VDRVSTPKWKVDQEAELVGALLGRRVECDVLDVE